MNTVIAIFSLVRSALVLERGLDDAAVALAMSIFLFSLALGGIVGGLVLAFVTPRILTLAAAALFGGGWFLAGSAYDPVSLHLTLGVMGGFGAGLVYNPAISLTLGWFPDHPGMVSGIILGAGAIGPAALAPLFAAAVSEWGVGTALRLLGAVLAVFTLVGAVTLRAPRAPETTRARRALRERLLPLRSPRFWMIFALFAIVTTPGNMTVSALAGIVDVQLAEAVTDTRALGLLLVTTLPFANFGGRLLFGALFDRWGPVVPLALCLAGTGASLIGLLAARDVLSFAIALYGLGVVFGSTLVLFPPLTAREFGYDDLPLVYGVMFVGYAAGGLMGPLLTGVLADPGAGTGGYSGAYLAALALCLVGAILLAVLRRTPRARPVEAPGARG
ncbi:MFS transporter [Microbacterium sp.]|uniref:MFS transporter n=1 Tax=Microbacterium sp. TaxID=51671 RepID=UPI003C7559A3